VSFDRGEFHLEWEGAELEYELGKDVNCNDLSYDVFLVPAPFNFEHYEIKDLINLVDTSDDMMHLETDEHFLDIVDLQSDMVYSVLVVANVKGTLYSHNRESAELKVARCNCAMEPDVNFVGTYNGAAGKNMIIEYDNLTSKLTIESAKLPAELLEVEKGDFFGVITTLPYDENFIFKVEVIGMTSDTRIELKVSEAALSDLFQDLDLDMVERIEKPVDTRVSDKGRELVEKTLFDKKFEIDETKNIGPLTARGRYVLKPVTSLCLCGCVFSISLLSFIAQDCASRLPQSLRFHKFQDQVDVARAQHQAQGSECIINHRWVHGNSP
jgi:hypothetical protein